MGWNKQSGEAWVLQRTLHTEGEDTAVKALELRITGLLTIRDAELLGSALLEEAQAARRSEETRQFIGERLGIKVQPWQQEIIERVRNEQKPRIGEFRCRRCGGMIQTHQWRFGSPENGWEHMEGECIVIDGRIDYGPQFDEGDDVTPP